MYLIRKKGEKEKEKRKKLSYSLFTDNSTVVYV